ncbi:RNA polymerase sigma factor [Chitinophaga rhizosphaerae]|uniref:RNA polymerase sigma factor n=1 Tax=Chitinophaga rhizosphaerae TaxID=1864947 RepID=UPI0013DF830B|nr:sigma-70 family RNA polymerase sigma factor [Chitinophaga rhizosphaerae]
MTGEDTTGIQDSELLLQVAKGDEKAFTTLYWQYSGTLYRNFLRMVKDETIAEELVQDLFSRIWQKRESLQVEKSFKAYLFRAGYHLMIDFYRKLKRDQDLYGHFRQVASENYNHIEEIFNLKDSQALLARALDALSPQQQKAFRLCRMEGKTYREAAEEMGISPHTVKEYFTKANHAVRAYLAEHIDISLGLLLLYVLHRSL